jgi:hypothetical protein
MQQRNGWSEEWGRRVGEPGLDPQHGPKLHPIGREVAGSRPLNESRSS